MTFRKPSMVLGLVAGLLGLAGSGAQAAVTITAVEAGNNVVFVANGSLDVTGLTKSGPGPALVSIHPGTGSVVMGESPSNLDHYGPITEPGPFGTQGPFTGDQSSGPRWGVNPDRGDVGKLFVPIGYVSGQSLNSTLVFFGKSIKSLGMTPGSYTWSWPADSVTLNIVPLPAALPLLASALGLAGLFRWRQGRVSNLAG